MALSKFEADPTLSFEVAHSFFNSMFVLER